MSHVVENNGNYLSTSTSRNVAKEFPKEYAGYLYEINVQKNAINVADVLRDALAQDRMTSAAYESFLLEKEIAIPRHIKPQDIKGSWPINVTVKNSLFTLFDEVSIRSIGEPFIPNPHYVSSGLTMPIPSQSLKAMRRIGHGVAAVGLALDGLSLHKAYQESITSGDYDGFFREGARIIGGWSGAAAVGTTFAKAGAVGCAPLGPYGPPVCGIVGGVVGSVVGYMGGSALGRAGYDQAVGKTSSNPLAAHISVSSPRPNPVSTASESRSGFLRSMASPKPDAVFSRSPAASEKPPEVLIAEHQPLASLIETEDFLNTVFLGERGPSSIPAVAPAEATTSIFDSISAALGFSQTAAAELPSALPGDEPMRRVFERRAPSEKEVREEAEKEARLTLQKDEERAWLKKSRATGGMSTEDSNHYDQYEDYKAARQKAEIERKDEPVTRDGDAARSSAAPIAPSTAMPTVSAPSITPTRVSVRAPSHVPTRETAGDIETARLNRESVRIQAERTTFAQVLPSNLTPEQRSKILESIHPREQADTYTRIYNEEMSPEQRTAANNEVCDNVNARADAVRLNAFPNKDMSATTVKTVMTDAHGVAFAASAFAALAESPRMQKGLEQVAGGAMAIAAGYGAIETAGMVATAGPVGLCVGGAIMILMGASTMLSSGSDDDPMAKVFEQIMEGLLAISRQITQLGEYVTLRFDRLEKVLGSQHREALEFLNQILFNQDASVSDLQHTLRKNHRELLLKIQKLQAAIQHLTDLQREQIESQLHRDYSLSTELHFIQNMEGERLIQEVKSALGHCEPLDKSFARFSYKLRKAFSTCGTQTASFTGKDIPVDFSALEPHHIETLLNRWVVRMEKSDESMTASNISALLRYAAAHGALTPFSEMPHPRVMKRFAVTLLELHEAYRKTLVSIETQKPIPEAAYRDIQRVTSELAKAATQIASIDAKKVLQQTVKDIERYHAEASICVAEALEAFEVGVARRYLEERYKDLDRVEDLARLPVRASTVTKFPEENLTLKYVARPCAMGKYYYLKTGEVFSHMPFFFQAPPEMLAKFREILAPFSPPECDSRGELVYFGTNGGAHCLPDGVSGLFMEAAAQEVCYADSDPAVLKSLIYDGQDLVRGYNPGWECSIYDHTPFADLDFRVQVGETNASWPEKIETNRNQSGETFAENIAKAKKAIRTAIDRKTTIHLFNEDVGLDKLMTLGARLVEPAPGQSSALRLPLFEAPSAFSYQRYIPEEAILAELLGLGRIKFSYTTQLRQKSGDKQVFRFGLNIDFVPNDGVDVSIRLFSQSHTEVVGSFYTKADEVLESMWYGWPILTPKKIDLSCDLFRHLNPFYQRKIFPKLSDSILQSALEARDSDNILRRARASHRIEVLNKAHLSILRLEFNQVILGRIGSYGDPLCQAITKMETMVAMLKSYSNLLLPEPQQQALNNAINKIAYLHRQSIIAYLKEKSWSETRYLHDSMGDRAVNIRSLSGKISTILKGVLATGDGELHVLHDKLSAYLKTVRSVHVPTTEDKLLEALGAFTVTHLPPEEQLAEGLRLLSLHGEQITRASQALRFALKKTQVLVSDTLIHNASYEVIAKKVSDLLGAVEEEPEVRRSEEDSVFSLPSTVYSAVGLFPMLLKRGVDHQTIQPFLFGKKDDTCAIIVNEQETFSGKTPLHLAAMRGDVALVKLLLSMDARIDIPDNAGHLCWQGASRDIRALIRTRGAWLAQTASLGFSLNRTVGLIEQAYDTILALDVLSAPGFLLMGPTGAGKSTLTNASIGVTYTSEERHGVMVMIPSADSRPEVARTSASSISETLFPSVYLTPDKSTSMVDMPGIGDTRRDPELICGGVVSQLMFQQFETLKGFGMVCPFDDLKDKFINPRAIFKDIGMMFKDIPDDIMQAHLLFLVTKTGEIAPDRITKLVISRLQKWMADEYQHITEISAPELMATKRVLSMLINKPALIMVMDVTVPASMTAFHTQIAKMTPMKSSELTFTDTHRALSLFKLLLRNMLDSRTQLSQDLHNHQAALAAKLVTELPLGEALALPKALQDLCGSLRAILPTANPELAERIGRFLQAAATAEAQSTPLSAALQSLRLALTGIEPLGAVAAGSLEDLHENVLERLAALQINADFFQQMLNIAERLNCVKPLEAPHHASDMSGYETDDGEDALLEEITQSYLDEHGVAFITEATDEDDPPAWKKPSGALPGVRRLEIKLQTSARARFFSYLTNTLGYTVHEEHDTCGATQIELMLATKRS